MVIQHFIDNPKGIRALVEEAFVRTHRKPGVTFLVCNAKSAIKMTAPAEGAPLSPSLDECRNTVLAFAMAAGEQDGGLLLIVERGGTELMLDSDRRWFRAMCEICAWYGVHMLGVWIVTPGHAREMTVDDVGWTAGVP